MPPWNRFREYLRKLFKLTTIPPLRRGITPFPDNDYDLFGILAQAIQTSQNATEKGVGENQLCFDIGALKLKEVFWRMEDPILLLEQYHHDDGHGITTCSAHFCMLFQWHIYDLKSGEQAFLWVEGICPSSEEPFLFYHDLRICHLNHVLQNLTTMYPMGPQDVAQVHENRRKAASLKQATHTDAQNKK